MKIAVFMTGLGLGGTEKAACRWAQGLQQRGHVVVVMAMADGPRRAELEENSVTVRITGSTPAAIANGLREIAPDLVHAHAPGHAFAGDVLGDALALLPKKIPVVQTNVFGQLWNNKEDRWTDFRLFISWTSCVQAARRVWLPLDGKFFQRNSVAVYPLDVMEPSAPESIQAFRRQHGVADDEVLFGRFSRPDPVKWTNLALDSFRRAARHDPKIKLLLREPPPRVAAELRASADAGRFIILPATADAHELLLTMSAINVGLHTSSIGESFGYGIAELMNLGKPTITHSVPWHDQAQIELVRYGECGFVASTCAAMARAILTMAKDPQRRRQMGISAREHVRQLADPDTSITRMEKVFSAVLNGQPNPLAAEDLQHARKTAAYLDEQQFGHTFGEQAKLRTRYLRARFFQSRELYRNRRQSRG